MPRPKKGGAVELAPVAAAGVLLAAQKMYADMVAEDKKSSAAPTFRKGKRFSRRTQRGGDSAELSAALGAYRRLQEVEKIVFRAKMDLPEPLTPSASEIESVNVQQASQSGNTVSGENETFEQQDQPVELEVGDEGENKSGGAKKRRGSKKHGGAAGAPLSPAEALIPKMDTTASELVGGAKKSKSSKSRKPRKMSGGELQQYAESISKLAGQLRTLM